MSDYKKYYVSFGQNHTHNYNGMTLDKNCLLELEGIDYESIESYCRSMFGNKWALIYAEVELPKILKFFPDGIKK